MPVLPPASFSFDPCDPALVAELRRELGCTETLAWVLARRGVTAAGARELVDDDQALDAARFHDPFLLGDMPAAVERIRFAIEQHETIVVHGDYDADGICATTLLVEGLEALGADVRAFLPDRFANGYGLQLEQAERFARDGARLLITVDCGITAVEPIAHATDLGLDVIVCDHHLPGAVLPAAIIASTRPGDYPFPDLCATAVAGKLVQALGGPSGPAQHELEAIATVADCVPLVGENRALVRRGLRALRATERPGLRALVDRAGLRPHDVDAEAIAFKLAPRLNATGRVDSPERAYELLRADADRAASLAEGIEATNLRRREIERGISDQAIEQVESWPPERREDRVLVVHGDGWHEGVVGIVASRLVERYGRPVIVVAGGDPARASGRSIDGVDLHEALAACDDLLLRWGGHAQAGGLTIDPTRIEELRARLAEWGRASIPDELLVPRDRVDAVIAAGDLSWELVQELERLAPFGSGWERPRLLATDARIDGMKAIGGDGSHLRCQVAVGESVAPGIGFSMAHLIPFLSGVTVDIALRPTINRFRGVESLQVELDRIYPIPTDAPTIAGWCATRCDMSCRERVQPADVLDAATTLLPSTLAEAMSGEPVALEPLLGRAATVDLRHRGAGTGHVAQLLGAGASVAVVVADVSRRRELLASLAQPGRFGVVAAALASERCAPLGIRARLNRLAAAAGPRLLVCDPASFDHVLDGPFLPDAVVVLDPPSTAAQRDLLAASPAPLHLVFGAREERFSAAALAAALDVRATLADAYRALRDGGPLADAALEQALFGSAEHLHTPGAVVHGLRTLIERGIFALDVEGRLVLGSDAPVATPPTPA